jgi:hypothetical protein
MGRRNKSNKKPTVAERVEARKQVREDEARQLVQTKFQRKEQAEVWNDLVRNHGGDVPVPLIHRFMADRRKATIAPGSVKA